MRVLLTLWDLYKGIGGGQVVYRRLIESNPDIEFSYLRVAESQDAQRPVNARTIPPFPRRALRLNTPPPHPSYERNALEEANAIARSVAGQSFDIVESPDFLTFGSALRDACAHHGVKVGRFVLSMHGNSSRSIDLNWGAAGDRVLEQKLLERRQFARADGVYGISRRYIHEWQRVIDRDVYYLDPAQFILAHTPGEAWTGSAPPSLYCIGRSERLKGNDLFIELVRWLDANSFGKVEHIGASDVFNGISSAYHLGNIAKVRGIEIPHRPTLSHEGLAALYATSAIVVLPTRYDTLNLVALEALFSGCPVAVSTRAGVCDYLDEGHPHLPYLKLDLDDFYGNIPALRDLIDNYHARRQALHLALKKYPPIPATPVDMQAVYGAILDAPPRVNGVPHRSFQLGGLSDSIRLRNEDASEMACGSLTYEEGAYPVRHRVLHLARRMCPDGWRNRLHPLVRSPRRFIIDRLRTSGYFGDAYYFSALLDSRWVPHRLRDLGGRAERSQDHLKEKLSTAYHYASSPLFRCNFWLDIARIERLRGQDLMAAVYELRLLRLLGDDRLGLVPRLTDTLETHGFHREAEGVRALYVDPSTAPEHVHALLRDGFEELRYYNEKPWAVIDDRRAGAARVAVIVSLYKAADKLRFFLTALAQQTLVRQDQVEIILVDSGSPTDERAVFEAFYRASPLNMIYARSSTRETIQAAWNRGIKLARAPYLVFLGVDEALYPEALEVLAEELDHHPNADWVMANSIVAAVDENGLYKNDIMTYDRSGATKDHVYLETCYLSWVGGMYRRTIHDRYGYYDESFRGAGDTEFKNRILPYISVRFVDRMLGLLLNYPDGQTTASPMAEIEDSRAWYLHRTAGGLRYAFANRPVEDAEALLHLALGYRKSHFRRTSTDVEYAVMLTDYILSRKPHSLPAITAGPWLRKLLSHLRRLEFTWEPPSRLDAIANMIRAWHAAQGWQDSQRKDAACRGGQLHCKVLNDNRYEQHSWLWKTI
jgi:glycosyltransferase involved in cell wall biosynthesis